MQEMLYPAAVVLLGYVVLGITGFGSALVIVPLLAWRWPLTEVSCPWCCCWMCRHRCCWVG